MECDRCRKAESQLAEARASISTGLDAVQRSVEAHQSVAGLMMAVGCPHCDSCIHGGAIAAGDPHGARPWRHVDPEVVAPPHVVLHPDTDMLTTREQEVLLLVVRGLSNRRIARSLGIAEKTVKNHLAAIFAKLGVSDRTQAAVHAIRVGMAGA